MIRSITSAKIHRPIPSLSKLLPSQASFRAFPAVGSRQQAAVTTQAGRSDNMDKSQNPNEKTGDVMSQSFGEGYSTRSDEEGFGGVYSDQNQCMPQTDGDKIIQETNHPAYDKTQGSEVKEKEKARHQTNANC